MNTNPKSQQELIFENIVNAKNMGIAHISADEIVHPGRIIKVKGREVVNFSSCSYMGLETDHRLKEGAIEAIQKYGVHISSSRAYISAKIYEELESNLSKVFGYPTVVFASTTLAHISLLPLYIKQNDAIILDHQVHSSIKLNVNVTGLPRQNISVIRHNRMDYLEERIKKLKDGHDKIWYMADSVYSMYGDVAPLEDLEYLLKKYDNFYLYIDDAHGMSWEGKNGSGFLLSKLCLNPKIRMVTSLGKGFGTGGAAVVCHDENLRSIVRNCAGTLIFSGPLEPATLGAALASSKIHLSNEIVEMQADLKAKVDYLYKKAITAGLPMINSGETPLFYFGMGKPIVGFKIVQALMNAGVYANVAAYPSVPFNNTGLRLMVNLHHEYKDLDLLVDLISTYLPEVLLSENHTIEQINKAFGRRMSEPIFLAS